MIKLILQPCGNRGSRAHYNDTIENYVPLENIKNYFNAEQLSNLNEIYPDGKLRVWGVTQGKNGINKKKWDRISVGDVTLFSKEGRIFSTGVTSYKLLNKDLAVKLWGLDSNQQTWECIYFVSELRKQNITQLEINTLLGYKENNVIQGFTVLPEEKSSKIISSYDLESDIFFPTENIEKEIVFVGKNIDGQAVVQIRREQNLMRKHLLNGRNSGKCAICSAEYPEEFLVAAHIKKRSLCSDSEKSDLSNIACLMCNFGCDDLYERGIISVKNKKVEILNYYKNFPHINSYLKKIEGKICNAYKESNKKYFDWHYKINTEFP